MTAKVSFGSPMIILHPPAQGKDKRMICIYHANCNDGFGAAYAVWKSLPHKDIEFIPASYGDPPPDVTGRQVVIVDFSYPRAVLEEMHAKAAGLLVLDHHKTAQADLDGLGYAKFDMTKSGARLAWEQFNPEEPLPDLLKFIEDRDLWQFNFIGTKAVHAALGTYPRDFKVWDALSIETLINEGNAVLRYVEQRIEELKPLAYYADFDGVTVPVINAPKFILSDLLNVLAKGEPFAVGWQDDGTYRNVSLRSDQNGMDVSGIARKFGGGGHAHAAGFRALLSEISPWKVRHD